MWHSVRWSVQRSLAWSLANEGYGTLTEWDRRVPPQQLEYDRIHVRQARAVRERGKALPGRTEDRVELGLGAGLDIGIERHRKEEGGEGGRGLVGRHDDVPLVNRCSCRYNSGAYRVNATCAIYLALA